MSIIQNTYNASKLRERGKLGNPTYKIPYSVLGRICPCAIVLFQESMEVINMTGEDRELIPDMLEK